MAAIGGALGEERAAEAAALRNLRRFRSRILFIVLALAGLGVLAIWCTSVGAANIGMQKVVSILAHKMGAPLPADLKASEVTVVTHLRLPRIATAVLGGAALGVSGTVMQGVTRNPLVSPYTLGVSAAAAFGASLAIIVGFGEMAGGQWVIVTAAFACALLSAALVFGAGLRVGTAPETVILTGIALMYLFVAGTATIQFLATEEQLASVVHWTFGSLTRAGWLAVIVMAVISLVSWPFLFRHAWSLNAMASGGDDFARSLGVPVERVRFSVCFVAVLLTSTVISFTGVIGFVGLVAPHMARIIIGTDHRLLLPFSGIVGAWLLLAADLAGRVLVAPTVLPVGITVAYLGVPIFLHLVLRSRQREIA
ncbi:MAG: FecCD family ABC transporter permease [Tropicimonas sp.]|uniref:FecCD family ABC transporter permease n=1 Tax=Tropicimonas sp. TaxID=2067044 RepID=UPI003A8C4313